MKASTAIFKRLVVNEKSPGQFDVSLNGQVIGSIEQESRCFYGAFVGEHAAGGGRTVENAKRSIAVNYAWMTR